MILFEDNISEEDIMKTDQILDFYVGSYENINDANKYSLIDMFTDSGTRSISSDDV